MQIY